MPAVLQRAVALVEPLLDPLHPAHEEFKRRGLEQLALVNGVNYTDLDQRRCAICQAVGHLGASNLLMNFLRFSFLWTVLHQRSLNVFITKSRGEESMVGFLGCLQLTNARIIKNSNPSKNPNL